MNIVIPMAGLGKRFADKNWLRPKPLLQVGKETMIEAAIRSLNLKGKYIFIVRKYEKKEYNEELLKILRTIQKDCVILEIDYLTEGPATTAFLAKDYINNEEQLVITNCDQIMNWNSNSFLSHTRDHNLDGCVVVYESSTEKNSYVKLGEDGLAKRFEEKKVISNDSLNGIHWWKKGKYFVESYLKMEQANDRCNNEFYISKSYNYILNRRIGAYKIHNLEHWAVGTPEDLENYLKYEKKEVKRIEEMKGGWFIGDFLPSIIRTKDFEVCHKIHKKGSYWDSHYHKIATEVTFLVRGKMRSKDQIFHEGDIWVFEPFETCEPEFLEDCEVIAIKFPSLTNDKYGVKQ